MGHGDVARGAIQRLEGLCPHLRGCLDLCDCAHSMGRSQSLSCSGSPDGPAKERQFEEFSFYSLIFQGLGKPLQCPKKCLTPIFCGDIIRLPPPQRGRAWSVYQSLGYRVARPRRPGNVTAFWISNGERRERRLGLFAVASPVGAANPIRQQLFLDRSEQHNSLLLFNAGTQVS